jgi:hypothetical protein
MYSTFAVNDNATTQTGRGLGWSDIETLLLIECYATHLPLIDQSQNDHDKGVAYRNLSKEYNEKAQQKNCLPRNLEAIKNKWRLLIEGFKQEFIRRHTSGESGGFVFAPGSLYAKIDELLGDYPTIRPPITYTSHSRQFTDNRRQTPENDTNEEARQANEHVRPSMPEDMERESCRRRTGPSQPTPPSPSLSVQLTDDTPQPTLRQQAPSAPPQQGTSRQRAQPANLTSEQLGWETIQNRVSDRALDRHERTLRECMDMQIASNNTNANNLIAEMRESNAIFRRSEAQMGELLALLAHQTRDNQ